VDKEGGNEDNSQVDKEWTKSAVVDKLKIKELRQSAKKEDVRGRDWTAVSTCCSQFQDV